MAVKTSWEQATNRKGVKLYIIIVLMLQNVVETITLAKIDKDMLKNILEISIFLPVLSTQRAWPAAVELVWSV